MSRKNVFAIAILVSLAFAVAACEFSFSTANIANAYMAADAAGSQPTTVFSQDAVFYAIVDLANTPNTLWPLGQYRADIYLNDKLDTSLEFEVQ